MPKKTTLNDIKNCDVILAIHNKLSINFSYFVKANKLPTIKSNETTHGKR